MPGVRFATCLLPLVTLATLVPTSARADWPAQPFGNVGVCTAQDDQTIPRAVSDGQGGMIVVWKDHRSFSDDDIHAQRVSAKSVPPWTVNGVAICTAAGNQNWPAIAPDGSGGAVIAWSDLRSGGYVIYAQRVDAGGAVQWATDGVALTSVAGNKYRPQIVTDDAGGAIVAWEDLRATNPGLYAQRIDSFGMALWTPDGVAITTAGGNPRYISMDSDGSGGALLARADSCATRPGGSGEFPPRAPGEVTDGGPLARIPPGPLCARR